MKVLILHNQYRQRGGEDACVDALSRLLKNYGQEVRTIFATNDQIENAFSAVRASASWIYSRKSRELVASTINLFKPDVVHVHNLFPLLSPSVIYACNAAGVPVVQTLHNYRLLCPNGMLFRSGNSCEECVGKFFPWPGIVHRCYRKSAVGTGLVGMGSTIHRSLGVYSHRVARFIVLTEFAKQKLASASLPGQKITVVPNWITEDPGVGNGEGGYFLFVGRLSPEKGLDTLLKAWRNVKPGARLKVVGTGPLQQSVVEIARVEPGVEYLGYQPSGSVFKLMQGATAIIVPSKWYEGLPLTMIESYASGTPVIASRIGSLEELVRDHSTGILFPVSDSDALTESINWMISNLHDLRSMRAAARSEYEMKYTPERGYQQHIRVYNEAIISGERSKCLEIL